MANIYCISKNPQFALYLALILEHEAARARNSNHKWHRTWGLDNSVLRVALVNFGLVAAIRHCPSQPIIVAGWLSTKTIKHWAIAHE